MEKGQRANYKEASFGLLLSNLIGDESDWTKLALRLYLGKLHLKILNIWREYGYMKKRSVSPRMYWKIGKEQKYFLDSGKKAARRGMGRGKLPHEALSEMLEGNVRPSDSEPSESSPDKDKDPERFTWGKRTFEACYYLYEVIPVENRINENVPWSIYQEIASERGRILSRKKTEQSSLISAITSVRSKLGPKLSDRCVRSALDSLLEQEGNLTKRTCEDELKFFVRITEKHYETRSNLQVPRRKLESERDAILKFFSEQRCKDRAQYEEVYLDKVLAKIKAFKEPLSSLEAMKVIKA